MAYVAESQVYTEGIYQLETTDPVIGGTSGIANQQAKDLANRTVVVITTVKLNYIKHSIFSIAGIDSKLYIIIDNINAIFNRSCKRHCN